MNETEVEQTTSDEEVKDAVSESEESSAELESGSTVEEEQTVMDKESDEDSIKPDLAGAESDVVLADEILKQRVLIEQKRQSVIGKTFESLTIGGRTYQGATVKEITDEEVKFSHSGGVASLKWIDLADQVKEAWGYDAQALEEKKRAEQEYLAKRDAWEKSPEGIAAREREEQALLEKAEQEKAANAERDEAQRIALARSQIVEISSELGRAKNALPELEESFGKIKDKYANEDAHKNRVSGYYNYKGIWVNRTRNRGVTTSSTERNKQLNFYQSRISQTKNKIVQLEAALKDAENELK